MYIQSRAVSQTLFVTTLTLIGLLSLSSAETYYVRTTSTTPCSEEETPCFTLSQYATKPNNYFDSSNTTFILLPGNHLLSFDLEFRSIERITLVPESNSPVTVICSNTDVNVRFENILNLNIHRIKVLGCTNSAVIAVNQFTLTSSTLQGFNQTALDLEQVELASIIDSSFISNTNREHFPNQGAAINVRNSNISIVNTVFNGNIAREMYNNSYGGAIHIEYGTITIEDSTFTSNVANEGGAIYALDSMVEIDGSAFTGNVAYIGGGAIYAIYSTIKIDGSAFTSNVAVSGGAIYLWECKFMSNHTTLINNRGKYNGGAIYLLDSMGTTRQCLFQNNTVKNGSDDTKGGAFCASGGNITVENSSFLNNYGRSGGAGYIYAHTNGEVVIRNCSILHNSGDKGCAFFISHSIVDSLNILIHNTEFKFNTAQENMLHIVGSSLLFSGNITILNNTRAFYAIGSNVTFAGNIILMNNVIPQGSGQLSSAQTVGTLTTFQSEIVFLGRVNITNNRGGSGGGIHLTESKLYTNGHTTIAYNNALNGGGIYAYQSELNLKGTNILKGNKALGKGGGIYAISTATKVVGMFDSLYSDMHVRILTVTENNAELGGGMYLESNAKLYHIKEAPDSMEKISFSKNSADYGGAMYISDDTNSTCAASPYTEGSAASECFLQTLALFPDMTENVKSTIFIDNMAKKGGHTLYGGLLDRCKISPLAEVVSYPSNTFDYHDYDDYYEPNPFDYYDDYYGPNPGPFDYQHGTNDYYEPNPSDYYDDYYEPNPGPWDAIKYVTTITNIPRNQIWSKVSSLPVRVCFCRNNTPDCDYHPPTLRVRKGEMFKIKLVAVDQINNTISNTTIYSSVSSDAGLNEGQAIQTTAKGCTEIQYTITSPHSSEGIEIYAEGPCQNTGISAQTLQVEFQTCPIGFTDTNSRCECNPQLSDYIAQCSLENKTLLKQDNSWISYINTTTHQGFTIYPHCPFHYCLSPTEQVWIDLNTQNGTDRQCALNRTGNLCGACDNGLSLILGSSRCMQCSNNWLALLIVFAIVGIVLVAFLLVCNLTVAIGTMNGLIFYANIVATSRATFFPFQTPLLFTIFISWINLDFGIEACFYDGMNSYAKTWLQLAFPLYIIFLVTLVIIACEYTTRLARLFNNTNPVATLATLILLSFTKSFRVIITALSSAVLEYPDGSRKSVWLEDANVQYFEGKHIPLFLTAIVILLIGIAYAFLLFFYQWLLKYSYIRGLGWIGHERFRPFMDAYHAPYSDKHRYWTGLLIFVRVFLYIIAALNVNGDPSVNLLSISCVLISLHIFVLLMPGNKIYKSWPLNALETSFTFNLIIFSVATLYVRETGENQVALACTSTSVAFITFLAFLAYHTYTFVLPKKIRNQLNERFGAFIAKLKCSKDTKEDEEEEDEEDAPEIVVREIVDITECTHTVVELIPTTESDNEEDELPPPARATGEAIKSTSQASDGNIVNHNVQIELQDI